MPSLTPDVWFEFDIILRLREEKSSNGIEGLTEPNWFPAHLYNEIMEKLNTFFFSIKRVI